jgi:hypothetical protein
MLGNVLVLCIGLICYFAGLVFGTRHARSIAAKNADKQRKDNLEALYQKDDEVLRVSRERDDAYKAVEQSAEALDSARTVLGEANGELELWQNRAARNFAAVERMEKERDEWKELYYRAGREMSRAQDMLLAEIERLSRGARIEVRPHLRDLVNGYREEHATHAKVQADRIAEKLGEPPPAAEPVAVEGH